MSYTYLETNIDFNIINLTIKFSLSFKGKIYIQGIVLFCFLANTNPEILRLIFVLQQQIILLINRASKRVLLLFLVNL